VPLASLFGAGISNELPAPNNWWAEQPHADAPFGAYAHTGPRGRRVAWLMTAVREDRMPLDDTGAEQPLELALKRALLEAALLSKTR